MYSISEWASIKAHLSYNLSTKLRESSGFSVQLATFLQWPTGNVIGYKSHVIAGKEMVREIWCKTWAKHSDKLLISLHGQAVADFKKYVNSTNFVTKWNVVRHLQSKYHLAGVNLVCLDSDSTLQLQPSSSTSTAKTLTQPKISHSLTDQATGAYRNLIRTSYMLAASG